MARIIAFLKFIISNVLNQIEDTPMELNILFNNFTIFSVLKLILTNRYYRVLYLYATSTAELSTDFSSKISELSSQYMIPTSVMIYNKIPLDRSKCEESILSIVLMNNSTDLTEISRLKKYLRPSEVNLVILTSNITMKEANFNLWMKSGLRVLILSNAFIASINQFHLNQIYKVSLQPLHIQDIQQFVYKYFSNKVDMNRTEINIFMQHLPPKASVAASDNGDIFTGPDGCLSELLVKLLKAKPKYWSDIGIMYPSFRKWINDPLVAPRSYYRRFHSEANTKNFISSFNET